MRRLALAGLAILAPALALARQPGPPIPLIPPASGPGQPAAPNSLSGGTAGTIPAAPLAPPAPGWSGDVSPESGALPSDFWRGTPRGLAEILLAQLPDTVSPALQSLERRLLLSPGAAPQGSDSAGLSLPALRAAALLRLGEIGAARTVIAAMPQDARADAAAVSVAAAATAGDTGRACTIVHRVIQAAQTSFWQRQLISCQALQGELREARFGLNLLAEQKAPHDAALNAAVDALAGKPAPGLINKLSDPDPLLLRLLVKARRRLAPAVITTLSPDLALTLALDEQAPPATQLAAAERAARFGALAPDRLRALYTALPEPRGPNSEAIFARARRYAAIGKADSPGQRLTRIVAFAKAFHAPKEGGLAFAARIVAPILKAIAPDPSLSAMAAPAARLLIAAGDADAARRWTKLVSADEQPDIAELVRLATTAGAEPSAAAPSADPPAADPPSPKSLMRLALAAALGQPIPTAAWAQLPAKAWRGAGGPSAPAAARLVLSAASHGKRIGETVLAAILAAGAEGRLSADPAVLYAAIAGLRRAGLTGAARQLAVEAALDAGF